MFTEHLYVICWSVTTSDSERLAALAALAQFTILVDHLICLFESRLSDVQEVLTCHACDLNGDSETGLVILRATADFFV